MYMMYVYDEIPYENSATHGNGSIFFGFSRKIVRKWLVFFGSFRVVMIIFSVIFTEMPSPVRRTEYGTQSDLCTKYGTTERYYRDVPNFVRSSNRVRNGGCDLSLER